MNRLLPLAMLLAVSAMPTFGQEAQCFQNEHYLVVVEERLDPVGSDFIIRQPARGKIACSAAPQSGDRTIGSPEDALHFLDQAGSYLVLERSTGPDGELVVYDLDATPLEPVIDVPIGYGIEVDDEQIAYWERTDQGTAENCPDFAEHQSYGFGSAIEEQRTFDVATGTISSTGEWRCDNTQ